MSGGFTHGKRHYDESRDEWYTPRWIFDDLAFTFDLDPCASGRVDDPVPARVKLTKDKDGLAYDWTGSTVFLNPPYSNTSRWVDKLIESGCDYITLTFARTDSDWAQRLLARSDSVLFLRRRVRFIPGAGQNPGSPGAGSMMCCRGSRTRDALMRIEAKGVVLCPV